MIRLSNSILAAMIIPAGMCLASGWSGFPLAGNTAYPTWYAIQQDGESPLGQVFAALDERYRTVFGYGVEITNTVTVDAGWITEDAFIDGTWYDVWDGPDSNGLYEVYIDGVFLWVLPQQVRPDPQWYGFEQALLGGMQITNSYPASTNVVVTNTFGPFVVGAYTGSVPVTRATLDQLWYRIGEVAPWFEDFRGYTNVGEFLATDPAAYSTNGSSSGRYRKVLHTQSCMLGSMTGDAYPGLGWVEWVYYPTFGGRWVAVSRFAQGAFAIPETDTLMDAATCGASGEWTAANTMYTPSYLPEWFLFGDTNAPMPRWTYSGTGTPPSSVTLRGNVQAATWSTNYAPWAVSFNGYAFPTGALYTGMAASTGVTETVGYGQYSTNLWTAVAIDHVDGTGQPGDTVAVVWRLHHYARHRLYAEELDRMQEALSRMRYRVAYVHNSLGSGVGKGNAGHPYYSTGYRWNWPETNETWQLDADSGGTLGDGGGYAGSSDENYRDISVTIPAYTGLVAVASYNLHTAIGNLWSSFYDYVYTNGGFVLDNEEYHPVADWDTSVIPDSVRMHVVDSRSGLNSESGPTVVEVTGDQTRDGKSWNAYWWMFIEDWNFEYK